jgi:hypothetical protein
LPYGERIGRETRGADDFLFTEPASSPDHKGDILSKDL